MTARRIGQAMAIAAVVVGSALVVLDVARSKRFETALPALAVLLSGVALLVASRNTARFPAGTRISAPRLVAMAIVCGAGLLTGLGAVAFGALAELRLVGAVLTLQSLVLFAGATWARSSRSR
jgi:hypothetical protein